MTNYSPNMTEVLHPPCPELLRVAETIEKMIARYLLALRGATAGRWEAPQEAFALGWLLIRNVQATVMMARHDEALVTAAWANARVAFELSARIIWMLQPGDRYEAECRWLGFLGEWEQTERQLAREVADRAEFHNGRAEQIQEFREGVTLALPRGYRPAKMPHFRDMLTVLGNPQMYRLYREGSQYTHGSMYASSRYRKNLGIHKDFGDFTSTVDWILPMRLCWLSLREATKFLLDRLEVPESKMPDWNELNRNADAAFEKFAAYAVRSRSRDG